MSREEIIKIIRRHDDFLIAHGVRRIGIFGSFARGESREGSDIDLIVEFAEGMKNYDNFIDLCFFLEELLGRKIDLLTPESISPFLRPYIEKDVHYETIH